MRNDYGIPPSFQSATLESRPLRTQISAPIPPRALSILVTEIGPYGLTTAKSPIYDQDPFARGVAGNRSYNLYRFDNAERRPKRYDCLQCGQRHHRRQSASNHRSKTAARRSPLSRAHEVVARPRSTPALTHTARLRSRSYRRGAPNPLFHSSG